MRVPVGSRLQAKKRPGWRRVEVSGRWTSINPGALHLGATNQLVMTGGRSAGFGSAPNLPFDGFATPAGQQPSPAWSANTQECRPWRVELRR